MITPKKLIYFGSPSFAAQILKSLFDISDIQIVGVVTQPDKPLGRHGILTSSPVAQMADRHQLPTFKPTRLDQANLTHIKLLKPDIFLVVSYGKIIPPDWLNIPTLGTFNIHFSLLPKYRGALCISEAIKNQDPTTGVTLMKMDAQLDHGPIISQSIVNIDNSDNVATLTTKLTQAAVQLLAQRLPEICAQSYSVIDQEHDQAVFTPKTSSISHDSAFIPYQKILDAIDGKDTTTTSALIRSLTPEPGPWTEINGKEIKLIDTSIVNEKLVINTVQLPGKSPISYKQFASGYLK